MMVVCKLVKNPEEDFPMMQLENDRLHKHTDFTETTNVM